MPFLTMLVVSEIALCVFCDLLILIGQLEHGGHDGVSLKVRLFVVLKKIDD